MSTVRAGDLVVLIADPLRHGYGVIEAALTDGTITVRWESGDIRPIDPHQLELVDRWEQRALGITNQAIHDWSSNDHRHS